MSKSRSRREYLILIDNIIVLDLIFNLTKRSNLTGRLYYNLTQCFDNLEVAYFLGHPVLSLLFVLSFTTDKRRKNSYNFFYLVNTKLSQKRNDVPVYLSNSAIRATSTVCRTSLLLM